jgi:hypothetical protein
MAGGVAGVLVAANPEHAGGSLAHACWAGSVPVGAGPEHAARGPVHAPHLRVRHARCAAWVVPVPSGWPLPGRRGLLLTLLPGLPSRGYGPRPQRPVTIRPGRHLPDIMRKTEGRAEPDAPTGAVAASLAELEAELARCDEGVLRHHCPGGDFSRWVAGVFRDGPLAADLAAAEASPAGRQPWRGYRTGTPGAHRGAPRPALQLNPLAWITPLRTGTGLPSTGRSALTGRTSRCGA